MGRTEDNAALRIGIIAPPWVAVPPPQYGGTELVIDQLARGLTAAGHAVELFATGDATCPVPKSWLYPRALGTNADPAVEFAHVRRAYEVLTDVDLVHDHTLTGPVFATSWRPELPVVTTNHGPFTPEMAAHFAMFAEQVPIIAISEAQRRSAPGIRIAAMIHHGIDVQEFPLGDGAGGYLLFLGRMNPQKGVHRAIDVAEAARIPLIIAAKMWEPEERRYFADQVEPRLSNDVVFIGQASCQRKLDLLAGAMALVNPIRWPEPFGLVMIEALACGTPVLAFAEGSAPEIVEHGRTGFLCIDEADMAQHVARVANLDRRACRASVAERFSTALFIERHLAFYRSVLRSDCPLGVSCSA
ncbi:MAG: glycosyltransferase family 4 protein [Acidimicrobiales bacterium]